MPDLHIFKVAVGMADPVALQDQLVAIHFIQNIYYKRVDFLEAVPEFQCVNVGAVLANNQSGRTNILNLDMADNEFGIFRWYPMDNGQYLFFHPAGLAKGQLKNIQAPYENTILANDPNLVSSEFAVWEDNRPAVQVVNPTAVALVASRLRAIGYRFHVSDILPRTRQEKGIVEAMRSELNIDAKTKDGEVLEMALKEARLPVTHIWASGRGIGD